MTPDIETILKEQIKQAIIDLWNYDIELGRYVDENKEIENRIKKLVSKYKMSFSEEEIRERMNKMLEDRKSTRLNSSHT